MMKFSNGGHLFACVDGQKLQIFNSYTLEKMHTVEMKCGPNSEISTVIFNDKDQSLSVASRDGYIGRWTLPQFHVISESILDELISYNSIDYFHDENAIDIN
jgi:WD40 repeat protein